MTVPTYAPILDSELEPGDSALASVFVRLRNNQLAAMNVDSGDTAPSPIAPYDFVIDNTDYAAIATGDVSSTIDPRPVWDEADPSELLKLDIKILFNLVGYSAWIHCRVTPLATPGVGVVGARAVGIAVKGTSAATSLFPVIVGTIENAEFGAVDLPVGETLVATFVGAYNTGRAYLSVDLTGGVLSVGLRADNSGPSGSRTATFISTTYRLHKRG